MESPQEATLSLPELIALLNAAKAQLGSWEAVAARIPDLSDETLRKIAEGETQKPTRRTITRIVEALATPPLPPGQAAELREALRLARQAVSIIERMVDRQAHAAQTKKTERQFIAQLRASVPKKGTELQEAIEDSIAADDILDNTEKNAKRHRKTATVAKGSKRRIS